MDSVELAWAAGLFEGEGCILIGKPYARNLGSLSASVTNTSRDVVEFFADRWGGTVRAVGGDSGTGIKRQAYRWVAVSRVAGRFLSDLEPFLRSEKYRARTALALEYQRQKVHATRQGAGYREAQFVYYERMAALTRRGADGQLALIGADR